MNEPKVFISYSHDDTEWVRKFAEALREKSVDVWLDAWQVHAGDSFSEALEAGLRGSDVIVAILSAANARRPNTLFELGVALSMGKGQRRNNYADLAADASRLASLLVAYIFPICALLAPCHLGASTPRSAYLFLRGP